MLVLSLAYAFWSPYKIKKRKEMNVTNKGKVVLIVDQNFTESDFLVALKSNAKLNQTL